MPETRAQAAQRQELDDNVDDNALPESPNGHELSFQDELVALVKEQQKLLRQYREEHDRQTYEMVDKVDRLSNEMKLLSTDFNMVLNKNSEYEVLIAGLQNKVKSLEIELEAAGDRLVKVHAGMLASSQQNLRDELYEELLAVINVRVTESVSTAVNKHNIESLKRNEAFQSLNIPGTSKQSKFPTKFEYENVSTPIPAKSANGEPVVVETKPTPVSYLATASRPVKKPSIFDGRTPWEAYHTQFEIVANINNWNNEEKAAFLATSLKGQALMVLSNLPPEGRSHYESLVTALESRFGNRRQTELNRMKLRSRSRRRDETLPELAEDIESLARLAYPDASSTVLETLTRDQFIDALTDDEIRLRVAQSRPTSLREALGVALELESFSLAARRRTRPVRIIEAPIKPADTDSGELADNASGMLKKSPDLLSELREMTNEMRNFVRSMSRRDKRPRSPSKTKRKCWTCESEEHLQKDCQKNERRSPQRRNERGSQQGNENTSSPGAGARQ